MVWTFDENGRTLSTTDALGNTTQTVYDALGRVKQVILPLLNETRLAYDSKHNILSETRVPIPGSPESPTQVFFTYHPTLNRVSSSTDALGRITNYTYDPNGNLTRVALPIINSIRPEINYTHNTRGQVLTIRDPEGRITRNRYDALTSELLEVIEDDGGKNISTAFTYDTAGNTKTVTNPNSHTTTFYYNPLGKVTASTGPAPFFYETRLIYDPAGNLIETGQRDSTRSNQWQSHAITYTPKTMPQTISMMQPDA
jgi:YD repeat-containing protein